MDSSLRLELLKNKTENARSAVASQEVREHLAGFIRSKRQGSTSQLNNIQERNNRNLQGDSNIDACRVEGGNYASCVGDNQTDDHPLRKTASMPTMHIPYKAQSLSRRRQLQRRTTMSPLAGRKSKPKPKRPIHTQIDRMNSNSTEYSSNPCIIEAAKANARSLSQSSTPPPSEQSDFISITHMGNDDISAKSDTHPLASSASSSHVRSHRKSEATNKLAHLTASRTVGSSSYPDSHAKNLKEQQHLKVTEAIRETLIRRTSDKQMVTNGSLDVNTIQVSIPATCEMSSNEEKSSLARCHIGPGTSNEFRQWSLDEPRDRAEHGRSIGLSMTQRASFSGNKRRANLSNDISLNIPKQSYRTPCSSMSIGGGGPILLSNSHHQTSGSIRGPPSVLNYAHNKHLYSSSSSSTSSLLSQQDSLEDSSSQAIDLSSSSERQRSTIAGTLHGRIKNHQLLQHQQQLVQSAASQKVLQESFRQLHLCQATTQDPTAIQPLLNPTQPQQQLNVTYQAPLSATNLPSSLNSATVQQRLQHTSSLDETANLLQATATRSTDSSSQIMTPKHVHIAAIHQSATTVQQTRAEMNHLIIAYKNLLGYQNKQVTHANELNEPYKFSLLSQLLLQHQQLPVTRPSPDLFQPVEPTRSAIWRTLSSPLLATGIASDEATFSDHEMAKLPHLNSLDERGNLTVGMQVDEQLPEHVHREKSPELQSLDLSMNGSQNKAPESRVSHGQVVLDATSANTNMSSRNLEADLFTFNPNSTTGITYDLEMCNHKCICGNESNHPENSYRVLAIWLRLQEKGLMDRCAKIEGRKATFEELRLCHSDIYTQYFGKTLSERSRLNDLDLSKLPIKGLLQLECGGQGADIDTAWNEELTPRAARVAAGCVIEAAMSVITGKLLNAFAIVRPPGHHAEFQQAMGFCYFNSVAIAASVLINKQLASRILIVDWDVHHGNGIQHLFYEDNRVLYISLHRHDRGNFFPGTGDTSELGAGPGLGYNINIAWSNEIMSDAEYLAAFRSIVMPIGIAFDPSLVLVASGFDAARGHAFNFGGYYLSPQCFASMTRQLMTLAEGRLVLCLEGGYQLNAICDCAESCVRALLNDLRCNPFDGISELEMRREPNQSACETLYELSNYAGKHWSSVEQWRSTIELSALEAATTSSLR